MKDNKDKLENEHKDNKKRKIEFRAKATNRDENREYRTNYKNGDWVYGLITDMENYYGYAQMVNSDGVSGIDVDPDTVGQFTGLCDKNGKKIYEGDVVEDVFDDCTYTVMFDEKRGGWYPFACGDGCGCCETEVTQPKYCKVVGNIYDNGDSDEE